MPEETTRDSHDISNNVKTRSSDWAAKHDETSSERYPSSNGIKEKDTKVSLNNNNLVKAKCIDKSSEQLLGSTFLPNGTTENGHALRASARVIHKLRMDSATPTSPPVTVFEGKKEDEFIGTGKKKEEHKVNPKTPSQPKSSFRMTWNNEEKDMFFDALNEYGRDFESIATYINNKHKRKNTTDLFFKTKDQVRVLYYQFYQKVSKYLKFSDGEFSLFEIKLNDIDFFCVFRGEEGPTRIVRTHKLWRDEEEAHFYQRKEFPQTTRACL